MTSATAYRHFGAGALLLAGLIGLSTMVPAQTPGQDEAAVTGQDQEQPTAVDRGKMRLKLLIRLVENELKEAELRQSRLTVEAAELDQQRRSIQAGPAKGTQEEKRQIDVIEDRLQKIDEEMIEVNGRLPEIKAELAELQSRLDEANGVVREPEAEAAENGQNGIVVSAASQWLDSKRRIQEALVYLGGYNALIDGDFGPRTQEAVKVYQGRQGLPGTGTLTDDQEAALLDEADLLRRRYGMTTIEDREAGYKVSYPSGLLPEGEAVGEGGRRFATKDGEGELLITSSADIGAGGVGDFSAVYDDLLAQYDVQYRRKRDDWFVVAGLIDEGRIIYDTARINGDRMIRARLSYPAEWRDLWSPFAVIMFNTFEALSVGES